MLWGMEMRKDKCYIPQIKNDTYLHRFVINVFYSKSWEFSYLEGIDKEYIIRPPS